MTSTRDSVASELEVVTHQTGPRAKHRWRHISLSVAFGGSLLAFASVLGTPYSADDVPNSGLPGYLAAKHITRWHYIAHYIVLWMRTQGRFFPGAVTETIVVFSTLTSRTPYKTFLFLLLTAVVVAFGLAIVRTMRDAGAAAIAAVALTSCWQFRYPVYFDAITSFSGLVPWSVLLMVGSFVLLSRRPRRWAPVSLVAGATLWAVAVVTYEVTVVVSPAVIAGFWLFGTDRNWRRLSQSAIVIPALALIAIDGWLRSSLSAPPVVDFRYRLGIVALATTVKQFVGAIPLSQYWIPGSAHPSVSLGWLWLPIALLAVLVGSAAIYLWRQSRLIDPKHLALLACIGIWIWGAPSVLVGFTERWQQQLLWGEAYLPVVYETIGFALLITAILGALLRVARSDSRWRASAATCATTLLSLLSAALALTGGLNYSLIR